MEITLNGAAHQINQLVYSLADLVAALNLSEKAIAVAVNRSIIPRQQWEQHLLQAQDIVDVVRAIGGG